MIEIVTEIEIEAVQTALSAATSCVPAWLVAVIVAAVSGRELMRWYRPQR